MAGFCPQLRPLTLLDQPRSLVVDQLLSAIGDADTRMVVLLDTKNVHSGKCAVIFARDFIEIRQVPGVGLLLILNEKRMTHYRKMINSNTKNENSI